MQHLRTLYDLSPGNIQEIFYLTAELKEKFRDGERGTQLAGRMIVLLFEKPSLRTRVSFEAAAVQLGGHATFLSTKEAGLQGRESLADVSRVLSGYCDAIVMRTFSQQLIDDVAAHAGCPVINGLSDDYHPCQALTDFFTIRETFGRLEGLQVAFVGDGNNVAASLAVASAMLSARLTIAAPSGYQLDEAFLADVRQRYPAAEITQTTDPQEAVREADVVYTDVWSSMGQESEADQRKKTFAPYQVNAELMAQAPAECRFMHDLPARRGQEVTDDVMDGPQSIVFQQAENRMHLAKGLLVWLLQ